MQSLGLTKSQLWKMIFYEGIGYWGILILGDTTSRKYCYMVFGGKQ